MRKVTIAKPSGQLAQLLEAAKSERVLLQQKGKPVAMLINVGGRNEEDLEIENSPEFWKMIEARRRRPTIPLAQLKHELFGSATTSKHKGGIPLEQVVARIEREERQLKAKSKTAKNGKHKKDSK